ncbi:flagellar hook-associated protein FlgK [Alkalibacter mobilis]|uniref:flagellar hook-associated protein FlgK n=1 Tax=Alkalibacter mobilis TaxID=2787712 RepID=UPI00189EDF9E|nr:flagellar hook-associated protein FlgK [Alkalibacter mobilis]MBF7096335.1 flagellar hook-associated protein FlgK [Alkalibacter mobilis]
MAGLFNTFNTSVKGLNAQQTALHTTSHNISNANTEGFSRQRVDMKADLAFDYAGVGQLGTGVKLEGVFRMVDEFVDYQIRNENSTLNEYMAKNDVMSQIEMVFNEPSDTGLNFAMGEMFNSWQELSKNPESLNAKSIVAEKSKTFADTLNHMAMQIEDLKEDTVSNISKNVYDVNSLITQINTVNEQIFNVSVKGHSPNDLLDTRDLLMKDLSDLTGFTETFDKWGRVSIEVDGQSLTEAPVNLKLSSISDISYDGGNATVLIAVGGDTTNMKSLTITSMEAQNFREGSTVFYDLDNDSIQVANMNSGEISGNIHALNEIDDRMNELDLFAQGTATVFNKVHNPDGSGKDFYVFSGSTGALNLKVNQDILDNEELVATGKSATSPAGDGSRALAIANLRNTKIDFNDLSTISYDAETMKISDVPGGVTVEGSFRDVVIKVGISTEHAANMVDNQEALMAQLNNRRESVSGVSIDEEVTNLIKFQRSFEANSRVISTISEMLDTLINRTGV